MLYNIKLTSLYKISTTCILPTALHWPYLDLKMRIKSEKKIWTVREKKSITIPTCSISIGTHVFAVYSMVCSKAMPWLIGSQWLGTYQGRRCFLLGHHQGRCGWPRSRPPNVGNLVVHRFPHPHRPSVELLYSPLTPWLHLPTRAPPGSTKKWDQVEKEINFYFKVIYIRWLFLLILLKVKK